MSIGVDGPVKCATCDSGIVIDPHASRCRKCRSENPDPVAPAPPRLPALSRVVAALESVFEVIRRQHAELPHFVVVVATGEEGKAGVTHWGHFAIQRWRTRTIMADEAETYSEVKISAEGLNRPTEEVLETMLHEAAHALADVRAIKDTSDSGRYHNARFARLAEEVGLTPPETPHPRYGFADTAPGPKLRERYGAQLDRLERALELYRVERPASAPKSRETDGKRVSVRCMCPDRSFRIVPSVLDRGPIICGVCDAVFAAEGDDEGEGS